MGSELAFNPGTQESLSGLGFRSRVLLAQTCCHNADGSPKPLPRPWLLEESSIKAVAALISIGTWEFPKIGDPNIVP